MADKSSDAGGVAGRILGGLALIAATAVWVAAAWLVLYRPDLLSPLGSEALIVGLALVWIVPFVLTLTAWLSLRRARRALAEARALHAETEGLAQQLKTQEVRIATDPARGTAPAADAPDGDVAPTTADPTQAAVVAALDFPRSEGDEAGFAALRQAMAADPKLAAVIQAAQHVLSLLAQDGVRLPPDDTPPTTPEVWRLFASGTRGPAVAALGATRDLNALELAVGRVRRDPAFRSAARRFVAAFDAWLAGFAAQADDALLARMGESRSARAFRLLGRATGSFG